MKLLLVLEIYFGGIQFSYHPHFWNEVEAECEGDEEDAGGERQPVPLEGPAHHVAQQDADGDENLKKKGLFISTF